MKGRKILREQLHFTEQNAETLMGQIKDHAGSVVLILTSV